MWLTKAIAVVQRCRVDHLIPYDLTLGILNSALSLYRVGEVRDLGLPPVERIPDPVPAKTPNPTFHCPLAGRRSPIFVGTGQGIRDC
ncbi:hypothetical protein O181_073624 [Austropuccinia psidii MF-1]|uniref:Uncharacterized protein n=1 Tax=Austropuccinia psidii MF-1 TaxID=1389203 RepID=A0A9Q3F722_9BASI|nr:hypothetical protein [Austropuccinia psidii MF-1]